MSLFDLSAGLVATQIIPMFLVLLMGHTVADFTLQSDTMGKSKNRNRPAQTPPPGQTPTTIWPYFLAAHAGTHGFLVMIITGLWWLALMETVAHAIIDFFKCENKLTVGQDQGLHVLCKAAWVAIAYYCI